MSIFLIGSSEDTPFEEALPGIDYELNAIVNPQRQLVVTRANSILAPEQQQALVDFADWKHTFPIGTTTIGRSLYARTKPDANWPVAGIKMKGAGGLREQDEKLQCYAPKPQANYGKAGEYHIGLDEKLDIQTIKGRPKALNSLCADSAENEYVLQERLAAADVGFRGLLSGTFKTNEGVPETDLHGNETGAVFLEYNPDFSFVGDFLKYCIAERKGKDEVIHSEVAHLSSAETTPDSLVENYISFAARMASAKHRATIIAGVGRHAGHFDNFMFNPGKEKTFVTDLDTAVSTEDYTSEQRGRLLMRDMGRDLVRMISTLSYYSYTDSFVAKLEQGAHKPFEAFLRGYLGDSIEEANLIEEAAKLQARYIDHVKEKKPRLDWMAAEVRNAVTTGHSEVPQKQMFSNWDMAHYMFGAECMASAHSLIRQSNLGDRGFELPDVPDEKLLAQLKKGVLAYCNTVQGESERVSRQALPQMY